MVNPDRNLYEPPYDDALLYDTDLEPERPRSRPLVVMLGFVVLAAFAGVVWVAYNQGIKQGQSGLPVLTAESGPTRVVPDQATAAPAVDPAPEKDYARLTSGDPENGQVNMLPQAERPKTTPSPQEVTGETGTGGPTGKKSSDFQAPGFASQPGIDPTVGKAISNGAVSEDITPSLPQATPPATNLIPSVPAPQQPKEVPPAPAPAPAPKAAPLAKVTDETTEAPKAAPPATGPMIQLGAFPTAKDAADAWGKIKGANQTLFAEQKPSINPVEVNGKGTLYRLRVGGFADKAAADAACTQLKAANQACIIAAK